jgi:hypothetical protein
MDCKLSIQAMIFWHTYYKRNPKMRTIWGTNEATVRWLAEQIAERRLYSGTICS